MLHGLAEHHLGLPRVECLTHGFYWVPPVAHGFPNLLHLPDNPI